jgi:hypothetical protein
VRHREVDRARADLLRPPCNAAAQLHRRLGPARDLDVSPCERARNAEAEGLANGLLAGEASGVTLRRIRARVAVRTLRFREAALAEARIAIERAADTLDLDQVDSDLQWFSW